MPAVWWSRWSPHCHAVSLCGAAGKWESGMQRPLGGGSSRKATAALVASSPAAAPALRSAQWRAAGASTLSQPRYCQCLPLQGGRESVGPQPWPCWAGWSCPTNLTVKPSLWFESSPVLLPGPLWAQCLMWNVPAPFVQPAPGISAVPSGLSLRLFLWSVIQLLKGNSGPPAWLLRAIASAWLRSGQTQPQSQGPLRDARLDLGIPVAPGGLDVQGQQDPGARSLWGIYRKALPCLSGACSMF